MTKSSTKNKEINGSLPNHSALTQGSTHQDQLVLAPVRAPSGAWIPALTDPAQNQTDILITNEQPRIENEVSKAVSDANNLQQEKNCCERWEKVICVFLVLTFLFVQFIRKNLHLIL